MTVMRAPTGSSFYDSPLCRCGLYCVKCQSAAEEGVTFRKKVGFDSEILCPYGFEAGDMPTSPAERSVRIAQMLSGAGEDMGHRSKRHRKDVVRMERQPQSQEHSARSRRKPSTFDSSSLDLPIKHIAKVQETRELRKRRASNPARSHVSRAVRSPIRKSVLVHVPLDASDVEVLWLACAIYRLFNFDVSLDFYLADGGLSHPAVTGQPFILEKTPPQERYEVHPSFAAARQAAKTQQTPYVEAVTAQVATQINCNTPEGINGHPFIDSTADPEGSVTVYADTEIIGRFPDIASALGDLRVEPYTGKWADFGGAVGYIGTDTAAALYAAIFGCHSILVTEDPLYAFIGVSRVTPATIATREFAITLQYMIRGTLSAVRDGKEAAAQKVLNEKVHSHRQFNKQFNKQASADNPQQDRIPEFKSSHTVVVDFRHGIPENLPEWKWGSSQETIYVGPVGTPAGTFPGATIEATHGWLSRVKNRVTNPWILWVDARSLDRMDADASIFSARVAPEAGSFVGGCVTYEAATKDKLDWVIRSPWFNGRSPAVKRTQGWYIPRLAAGVSAFGVGILDSAIAVDTDDVHAVALAVSSQFGAKVVAVNSVEPTDAGAPSLPYAFLTPVDLKTKWEDIYAFAPSAIRDPSLLRTLFSRADKLEHQLEHGCSSCKKAGIISKHSHIVRQVDQLLEAWFSQLPDDVGATILRVVAPGAEALYVPGRKTPYTVPEGFVMPERQVVDAVAVEDPAPTIAAVLDARHMPEADVQKRLRDLEMKTQQSGRHIEFIVFASEGEAFTTLAGDATVVDALSTACSMTEAATLVWLGKGARVTSSRFWDAVVNHVKHTHAGVYLGGEVKEAVLTAEVVDSVLHRPWFRGSLFFNRETNAVAVIQPDYMFLHRQLLEGFSASDSELPYLLPVRCSQVQDGAILVAPASRMGVAVEDPAPTDLPGAPVTDGWAEDAGILFLDLRKVLPFLEDLCDLAPETAANKASVKAAMNAFISAYEKSRDPKCPSCQRGSVLSALHAAEKTVTKTLFDPLIAAPEETRKRVFDFIRTRLGSSASVIYVPQGGVLYKK